MGHDHAVPKLKPSPPVAEEERQLHKGRCGGCPQDREVEVPRHYPFALR